MFRSLVAAAFTLSAVMPALGQVGMKVGVINSEIVVDNFPEFAQAEAQLGREVEGWQKERGAWENTMLKQREGIDDREAKLEAGQNVLAPERKTALQRELDSLKLDLSLKINQRATDEQTRFNSRRAELLAGVFETVNKTIEELGEQEGFDLIFDSANGTVVYARDPQEVTDQLLARLKK